MKISRRARLALLTALTLTSASSCVREYDFERRAPERGTLGQELHAIWRRDAARQPVQPQQRVALLDARQAEFVRAVDTIAPVAELSAVNAYLQDALVMVEEGTLPGLTRKLQIALREAAADPALTRALASTSSPPVQEYISPTAQPDLLGYITAYPKLAQLSARGAQIVLDNDGLNQANLPDAQEPNGLSELMRTASRLLSEVEEGAVESLLALMVRDMLLREDPRYEPADATRPLFVAKYDPRGLPSAKLPTPQAQTPFMDRDGDGLADINERGEFVLSVQDPSRVRAFYLGDGVDLFQRDAYGRAVLGGSPVFEYVDLNKTGLGFLVREAFELSSKNVITDLLGAIRAVMGDTTIQRDAQGPYQGFGSEHPLADLAYGATASLAIESLPELMEATATLMDQGDADLAAVLVALTEAVDIAQRYPESELSSNQTIAYDLSGVLHKISANPGLWEAFMGALADPMTLKAGEAMSTLIRHRNTRAQVQLGGRYDACFEGCASAHALGTMSRYTCVRACPHDEIFQAPMDHSAPESPESRSQLQALWHLMWSLTGVPYTMETTEVRFNGRLQPAPPPLITLPGGAEAYLRAVAGNLDLADHVPPELFTGPELGPMLRAFGIDSQNIAGLISLLSQLFGVKLDRKPTPAQLTRLFSKPEIAFRSDDGQLVLRLATPIDADGYNLAEHLADGLFEAEASGLIDAVYPMAKAFSDHDSEALLLELFKVVHMHYPGDPSLYKTRAGGVSPSNGANLRSFEPVMAEVFDQGRLLDALGKLSRRLQLLKRDRKVDLNEELRKLVHHATRPGFKGRQGQETLQLPNGRTLREVSRLHVIVRALEELGRRVEADAVARERFSVAAGHLLDLVLAAQWPRDGQPASFQKAGSVALTISATRFLADRAREARGRGELVRWMAEDLNAMLQDLWTSRLFAGLVLVAEQILAQEDNRRVLDDFIAYMLSAPRGREHATVMAYQTVLRSTQAQVWVPLARFLARQLDPDRVWQTGDDTSRLPLLSHGALALKRAVELDPSETGLALIHRGVSRREGDAPLGQVAQVVGEYWREDPTSGQAWTAQDYRLVFTRLADWLSDSKHGMEQIYDLVKLRR